MLLNTFRSGAQSKYAKVLMFFLLVAAVCGLGLNAGTGLRNAFGGDTNVATIGLETISVAEFDQIARNVLRKQNIDTKTAWQMGFIDQILQSELSERLTWKAAYDAGVRPGDNLIASEIQRLVEPYVSKDVTAKDAFARILSTQGMSEGQFASAMRSEMTNNTLRNALGLSTGWTPDAEARDLYVYANEERAIKFVSFPNDAIKDYKEPTDGTLLPLYEAGKERYALPETRSITIAALSADQVKKDIPVIPDSDLKAMYDKDTSVYAVPEQRKIEQAILMSKTAADDVAAKMKAGGNLKDVVKTVTGKQDGWLGEQTYQRNGLAKEIGEPAFKAQKGDQLGPIQSPLGWHVLIVRDIVAPHTRTFEEVKPDLLKEAQETKMDSQTAEFSGKIDDAVAGGQSLEDVAKANNMTLQTYGPLRADGSTPDSREGIKDFPKDRAVILKAAFELQQGESAPVIELTGGGYAVVRADTITQKTYKPFDQVKGEIRDTWVKDQQQVLNRQKVEKIAATLSATHTLEQVAKENNLTIQNVTIKRGDKPPAPLTGIAVSQFFDLDKGAYGSAPSLEGFVVGQVTDFTLPPADKIAQKDIDGIRAKTAQDEQQETLQSFQSWLHKQYRVTINRPLLAKTYGPANGEEQE
jgi:peptidyl-prolyl cis-trans isomerase D